MRLFTHRDGEHAGTFVLARIPSDSWNRQHFVTYDPFKEALLLSHCSSCLNLLSKPVQFSGQARRNQSANSVSTDETGRNQSAKTHLLDKVRQTRVPDPHCVITLKQVQGQTPLVHLIISLKKRFTAATTRQAAVLDSQALMEAKFITSVWILLPFYLVNPTENAVRKQKCIKLTVAGLSTRGDKGDAFRDTATWAISFLCKQT